MTNFGTRNELHAYNQRKRYEQADRIDRVIGIVSLVLVCIYVALAYWGAYA